MPVDEQGKVPLGGERILLDLSAFFIPWSQKAAGEIEIGEKC